MEKYSKIVGKLLENYWKIIGKVLENHWKIIGKLLENDWIILELKIAHHYQFKQIIHLPQYLMIIFSISCTNLLMPSSEANKLVGMTKRLG